MQQLPPNHLIIMTRSEHGASRVNSFSRELLKYRTKVDNIGRMKGTSFFKFLSNQFVETFSEHTKLFVAF